MTRRVYLALTLPALADAQAAGGFGPAPLQAHAVTPEVVRVVGGDEEECEYAVLLTAAQESLGLLGVDDPPVRVVAVCEAPAARPVGDAADPSLVVLDEVLRWDALRAVHVDDATAEEVVAAAVESGSEADAEACLDHDLGWHTPAEVPALVERLAD